MKAVTPAPVRFNTACGSSVSPALTKISSPLAIDRSGALGLLAKASADGVWDQASGDKSKAKVAKVSETLNRCILLLQLVYLLLLYKSFNKK
jgi:hypothetical protein